MQDAERNLWERYRAGDQQALEDLFVQYARLMRYWVNEIAKIGPWADRDDLIQEGRIALLKVFEKFDPSKGYEFSTYARKRVQKALKEHLQDSRNLTDYLYRQCRKVNKAQDALMRRLDRMPTVAEIAEKAELTEQQVEKTLDAMAIVHAEEWGDDDSHSAMSSATVESPETIVLINELLPRLNEKDRRVLIEYYYLGHTDKEIAEQRGLKLDTVKRIRDRALRKLAKMIGVTGR